MNLKQILENSACRAPEKTALVFGERRISYRELNETSNRIANFLIKTGLEKGEHAAVLMSHCPEWVANYFGVIKAGGVVVLLSSALKAPEIKALLVESDSKVLITERYFSNMLANYLPELSRQMRILEIDVPSYEAALAGSSAVSPSIDIKNDDNSTILYTSGVLGMHKGVVHTHASLLGTPDIVSAGIGRGGDDVVVDPVPFFYLLGLSELLFGSIIKGATVVIIPHFTPRAVLEAVEKERGTILFGVPAMHNALAMVRESVVQSFDIASLRVASTAGAKTSAHLMGMLQDKLGLTLCETYGLSELSVVSMSNLQNHKLGTVGKPTCPLRIVGDDGKEVPPGVIGEAVFKAPWAMKEYYKAPNLMAKVFKDGWFYTGDSVVMDEDGYLEYVEKKSFIIVTPSGLKISPWEVENLLLTHPDIAEAAYVGKKNSSDGLIPTAFVVLKEGCHTTDHELADYCCQNLADFKLPKRFEFVTSIPKTGSGKINRLLLQES